MWCFGTAPLAPSSSRQRLDRTVRMGCFETAPLAPGSSRQRLDRTVRMWCFETAPLAPGSSRQRLNRTVRMWCFKTAPLAPGSSRQRLDRTVRMWYFETMPLAPKDFSGSRHSLALERRNWFRPPNLLGLYTPGRSTFRPGSACGAELFTTSEHVLLGWGCRDLRAPAHT